MVGRNQKGQILIESIFLMFTFISLIVVLKGLITNHQTGINSKKLSKEISRGYRNEDSKN